MESKKINQLATELAPELSDLTIIGDPTTGISKKITLSQMASLFTGTVEEYASLSAFPLVGAADTIYIALDTNIIYRWNTGTSAYVELSPNIVTSLVFNDANGFDGTISLVGSTATLTITTALTQGSVPFIGTSGALTQDNANLFFDDTNNRLGINTNSPTTALDVFGSGIIGRINGTSTNNAFLGFASAGTNRWSIGNVQSDHRFRIYNEATTSELVSVLSTGEFGIGIANPTTKFHIDGAASALIANLDANVSVAKSISFRSDNSARINLEVSGTESGSNAGADLFIRRYSDAGALLDTSFFIKRSTGNIGIATTTPNIGGYGTNSRVLTIQGVSGSYGILELTSNSANADGNAIGRLDFGSDGQDPNYKAISSIASFLSGSTSTKFGADLRFYTRANNAATGDPVERMRITSGGELLINATTNGAPNLGYQLGVRGTNANSLISIALGNQTLSTQGVYIGLDGTVGYIHMIDNKPWIFSTNNTERMRITSEGNIGIGVTPSAWGTSSIKALQIGTFGSLAWTGGVDISIFNNAYYDGTNFKYIASQEAARYLMNRNNHHWYIAPAGSAGNNITFTESMRITNLGYTKITNNGSFVNTNGNYHEIVSNRNNDNIVYLGHAAASPYGPYIWFYNAAPNNSTNYFLACGDTSADRFIARSNGGLANYQANNLNLSDERTKKEITPLESYWNKFKNIEIVKFKYKDQTHNDFNIGVIAQQVEKVAPEFVDIDGWSKPKLDEKGNEIISEEEPLKSVYTADLHHATIKVLQEAMEKIEILEEKVKKLESK